MSTKTNKPADTAYPNLADFFKRNHTERNWATSETVSGVGSEIRFTRDLHTNLVALIKGLEIASVLDLPCGDLNYMKGILSELKADGVAIQYTGADIASNLIAENKKAYPELAFKTLNVVTAALPPADLVIVRDCLVHLPTDLVIEALGGWRTLDLCSAPFNLPPPLEYISENCEEYGGVFIDKSLGIWSPDQIRDAVNAIASSL